MGTVTSVATTNSITATKYNDLVNEVNAIIDTPSGSYVNDGTEGTIQGYGSSITQGSTVTNVDKITADDWNTVSNIVNLVTGHRTGTVGSLPTLTSTEKITAAKYNAIAAAHNTNYGDRFTVDSTNTSLTTVTTGTLAAGWNGNNQHVFNIVFASENDKFAFFNTGGSLRITASATYTGSEAKSIDWRNMVNNLEQVDIFADSITYTNSAYAGSTKLASYEGWYFLDSKPNGTPDTEIYKFTSDIDGGDAVYNENYVRYRFRRVNDTTYTIFLDFYDADVGDPLNDENVQTVVTTTVDVITPTGTFAATTPTFSANGSTVGFTATSGVPSVTPSVTSFTHVAASYERSTTDTTTKTFTVPAGAQAGDLLIATSFIDGDNNIPNDASQLGAAEGEYTISDPLTGWAKVGASTGGIEYPEGVTWIRVWDGVTSSWTVTWNNTDRSAGVMVAFRPDKSITSLSFEQFQESDGPSALSDTISSVTDTNAPGGRIYMYFLTGRPNFGLIQNPVPTFSPSTGWTHVDGAPLSSSNQMDYAYKLASAGDAFVSTTISTTDAGRQAQHFFIVNAE